MGHVGGLDFFVFLPISIPDHIFRHVRLKVFLSPKYYSISFSFDQLSSYPFAIPLTTVILSAGSLSARIMMSY